MFQNYSEDLYLPENVLLYREHEEGTDKSTFLEARFRDSRFKLLHTIILSRHKAHKFFRPLARFMCFYGQIP